MVKKTTATASTKAKTTVKSPVKTATPRKATVAAASPTSTPTSQPLPTSWLLVFAGIFVLIGLVGLYASDDQITRVSEEAYVDERPAVETPFTEGPRIQIINE